MSIDYRINYGQSFDYYTKISVTRSTFGDPNDGYKYDVLIPFNTQTLMLLNENTAATSVVEYSFNGITVHGELDPTLASKGMTFDNRPVCKMWLRLKSGSSGTVVIRVDAWSTP